MLNASPYDVELRVDQDLSKRSLPGTFIYFALWVMLACFSELNQDYPVALMILSLLVILISALRLIIVFKFDAIYSQNPLLWQRLMFAGAIFPAFLWGSIGTALLWTPQEESVELLVILIVMGLSTGGMTAFAPRLSISIAYVLVLLLPSVIILPLSGRAELWLTLATLFYMTYLFFMGTNLSREYWITIQTEEKLRLLSNSDGLTAVPNRRSFDEVIEKEWQRAKRNKQGLALLLIDLDHFKQINDDLGHMAGDEVLKKVAKVIAKTPKRLTDFLARFGGEEFVVLLPSTDLTDATTVAERIRKAIEELVVDFQDESITLTTSVGVSQIIPSESNSLDILIEQSDQALYQAKKQGRNRVCVFDSHS